MVQTLKQTQPPYILPELFLFKRKKSWLHDSSAASYTSYLFSVNSISPSCRDNTNIWQGESVKKSSRFWENKTQHGSYAHKHMSFESNFHKHLSFKCVKCVWKKDDKHAFSLGLTASSLGTYFCSARCPRVPGSLEAFNTYCSFKEERRTPHNPQNSH